MGLVNSWCSTTILPAHMSFLNTHCFKLRFGIEFKGYVLYQKLFFDISRGWASLFLVIIFFNAIQFLCFAILGEYLAVIFDETKKRQRYIVEEKINFN
tara:strand:+ start:1026 stop:1319 length:294 start_codon:yes stop_codon:yes gene_type:complete